MKVLAGPGDEVVIEILSRRGAAGVLPLHDGDQLLHDLIDLITGKQVGHLQGEYTIILFIHLLY